MEKSYYRSSRCILLLLALMILWLATAQAEDQPAVETSRGNQTSSIKPEGVSGMFKGTVMEVIDAGRQVYVDVDTGDKRLWVAAPAFDGKPGDKVLVPPCVPVADFQSRKLNRVFKTICFVGGIRRVDESTP